MATLLRGRGASPIRPGFIVRDVLSGKIPLETGELISEAAITDLHRAYRNVVSRENAIRPKARRLHGMTSFSFKTFFKFAQLLHLVELVREEPMLLPPATGQLFSIRIIEGKPKAVASTRRVFRLTTIGAAEERSWSDLRRAWQEQWPAPQKLEIPVGVPPVEKPAVKKPPVKEPTVTKPARFPTLRWVSAPSPRQFGFLLNHLEKLNVYGPMDERVIVEMDSLSMKIGDWELSIGDSLDDARAKNNKPAIEKYEEWQKHIADVREGLIDRDLEKASRSLRELVT